MIIPQCQIKREGLDKQLGIEMSCFIQKLQNRAVSIKKRVEMCSIECIKVQTSKITAAIQSRQQNIMIHCKKEY